MESILTISQGNNEEHKAINKKIQNAYDKHATRERKHVYRKACTHIYTVTKIKLLGVASVAVDCVLAVRMCVKL